MGRGGGEKGVPDLRALNPESILVIKYRALGDIVLLYPFLYGLRNTYPGSKISFLCMKNFSEALLGNEAVDELITFRDDLTSELVLFLRTMRRRFDLVLDLVSSPFSAYLTFVTQSHLRVGFDVGRQRWCYTHLLPRAFFKGGELEKMYTFDSNLRLLEVMGLDAKKALAGERESSRKTHLHGSGDGRYSLGFPPAEREMEWVNAYLSKTNPHGLRLVGIVPSSSHQAKSWPLERFTGLAAGLVDKGGILPMVIWGPGEKRDAEKITSKVNGVEMIPEMGVARLGAFISKLELLIGIDSGPKHIAVLLGVPTLTLFGPTDPYTWDPMTGMHRVIYSGLPCSPCGRKSCKPNRCMLEIGVDEVLKVALEILKV